MTKILKWTIALLLIENSYSIQPPSELEVISFEEGDGLLFDKGKAYEFTSEISPKGSGIKDITNDISFFRKNGYWLYRYDKTEHFLIPGDDFIQTFSIPTEDDFKGRYVKYYGVRGKNEDIQPPAEINIETISAKTALTEKIFGRKFEYKIDWLKRKFYKACSCHSFNYDELVPPWVEGQDDFGSGEELKISFKNPTDGITVLNGYVDIFRPYLYEQNNRLKKVQITSMNFDFEFEFTDVPRFTSIKLPKKTKEITLKILSVYEGSKYNDTAISAIIGFIPQKERKAEIKKQYKLK